MNILPSSAKYLYTLGKILYEPILRGESAFVRWAPGHGKTVLLSALFDTPLILKEHLGIFQKRYLFVRIDGYLFSSGPMSELFRSMHDALREICMTQKIYSKPKPSSQFTSMIITVKTIISLCQKSIQKGYEVIFLVDAIDEFSKENAQELFRGLEYIVESNRERIHTHINVNKMDIIDTCVSQTGLIQNIISIPLPDKEECLYFLRFFANKWILKLSDDQIKSIFKACGNDPVLLKESLRIIHTYKEPINLLTQPTLLLKAKINYTQYSIAEKDVIETKLKTNHILANQKKSAQELVFLHFWDKTYNIPLLFQRLILDSSSIKELRFDKKTKHLIFADLDLTKKLSHTEYEILVLLYKRIRKIVSRDEIALCIWKEKMIDKYSEWAIDKTISRLRGKLEQIAFTYKILTKKKEGFLLDI